MADQTKAHDLLSLTTDIVSAHVANNTVSLAELPALIHSVYRTLATIATRGPAPPHPPARPAPAVPVRKSVMPDYLVCLEDGKRLKMLKRHLKTAYNLTPEQDRARRGRQPGSP